MSYPFNYNQELVEICFTQYDLSSAERYVLLILCFFADTESYEVCFPQKEIAMMTGLERKTISKCIQSLQKKSMLIYANKYYGKTNAAKVYNINISKQEKTEIKKTNKRRNMSQVNRLKSIISLSKIHGYKCNICQTLEGLELDHINPLSRGGNDELENLQLLCKKCNLKKSDNIHLITN